MSAKDLMRKGVEVIGKNSPVILTGMAIAGLAGTAFMVYRGTKKSVKSIEKECEKLDIAEEEMPAKDKAKLCWKNYIPAVTLGVVTTTCIIGANTVNTKRNAALAGAYILTKDALSEYQEKVVNTIGESKSQKIADAIAQDHVTSNPLEEATIVETGDGQTLCFDRVSGRYFKSDMEKIRRVENDLNAMLLSSTWVSLNDAYFLLHIPDISIGDDLGWDLNADGLIDFRISSCISGNDQPCLTINPSITPKYKYYG